MDQRSPRRVHARLLTASGWVAGTFVLPALQPLADALQQPEGFLKLVEVTLPSYRQTLPFFAMARGAVTLVVPDEAQLDLEPRGAAGATPHHATVLLAHAYLTGTLHVPDGERLSDYLLAHTGFLPVHDVAIHQVTEDGTTDRAHRLVLVNAANVLGVTDQAG
jgi:hypothetical protein